MRLAWTLIKFLIFAFGLLTLAALAALSIDNASAFAFSSISFGAFTFRQTPEGNREG